MTILIILRINMLSFHHLPHQLPGEEIIKILRRDYFIIFKKIMLFVLLLFLLAVAGFVTFRAEPNILRGELSYPLLVLGMSVYLLFSWLFFFFSLTDYYLDVWIITNQRIIDIRQDGFFSRTISEQQINKIQDVTSDVKGVFPTIFKFGDVHVQTAGEVSRFFLAEIPEPNEVRNLIIKLADERKHHL